MEGIDWENFDRPKTIEQLMGFVREHNLPYEKMRFFIGEDYRGAKAFGIYQDADGDFVVYKNKADGTRAVRYKGPDQAHAVGELFDRLCAEIKNQKAHNAERRAARGTPSGAGSTSGGGDEDEGALFGGCLSVLTAVFGVLIAVSLGLGGLVFGLLTPTRGYYVYDHQYYCYNDGWYLYNDELGSWAPAKNPGNLFDYRKHLERRLTDDPGRTSSYREEQGYYGSGWEYRFEDTTYYDDWYEREYSNDDDDDSFWDDDDDWDWDDDDDWDSDDTDWDSDW